MTTVLRDERPDAFHAPIQGVDEATLALTLPPNWLACLRRFAESVNLTPAACARSLLIEVLHDDAIAHGEDV